MLRAWQFVLISATVLSGASNVNKVRMVALFLFITKHHIVQNMKCPICNLEIKDGLKFCPKCGSEIFNKGKNFQKKNFSIKATIINLIAILAICYFSLVNVKMIFLLSNARISQIERFVNGIYSELKTSNQAGSFEPISENDIKYFPDYFLDCLRKEISDRPELKEVLQNYDHWRGIVKGYNLIYEDAHITEIDNKQSHIFVDFKHLFAHSARVNLLITLHDSYNMKKKHFVKATLNVSFEDSRWIVYSIYLDDLPNKATYIVSLTHSPYYYIDE